MRQLALFRQDMLLCFILLAVMSPVFSCEQSRFLKDETLNDYFLFENFVLGPSSDKSKDECAKECHRNPSCTVFSISLGANFCQLYGDVVYPDVAMTPEPGRRYYVYNNGRCPYENEFVILRQSNQCIRIFKMILDYAGVIAECGKFGARPIVLENEEKANATLNLLHKNGDTDKHFYIGAQVQGTHPNFFWVDGQPLTRDWWLGIEPNNDGGDENCVINTENGMMDIACDTVYWFICEVPQGNLFGFQ